MLIASGGLAAVVHSLHHELQLGVKRCTSRRWSTTGNSVRTFVACSRAVGVRVAASPCWTAEPQQILLIYGVRHLPRPWLVVAPPRSHPALAALIGRSRATILTALELPKSTTYLAALTWSESSWSQPASIPATSVRPPASPPIWTVGAVSAHFGGRIVAQRGGALEDGAAGAWNALIGVLPRKLTGGRHCARSCANNAMSMSSTSAIQSGVIRSG